MRLKLLLISVLFLSGPLVKAQDSAKVLMAFRISDYIVRSNDSVSIVQVQLPDAWPFTIKEKQVGLLQTLYRNEPSYKQVSIGNGRCQLIKGNYYYFGIRETEGRKPQQGDLLYTMCTVPVKHEGLLFKTAAHAISFTRVTEDQFYYTAAVFTMSPEEEQAALDSMVDDIRYTGKAMLEQMPDANQVIKGGLFDGQKIFTAMQEVKRNDLIEFLKYIIARPEKYAGQVWKISEIMATWMVSKTPQVLKN